MSGKVYKQIRTIIQHAVGAKDRHEFNRMLREPASMVNKVCFANPIRRKYRQFKKIFFTKGAK